MMCNRYGMGDEVLRGFERLAGHLKLALATGLSESHQNHFWPI
jgi:hypothetical protein